MSRKSVGNRQIEAGVVQKQYVAKVKGVFPAEEVYFVPYLRVPPQKIQLKHRSSQSDSHA